MQIALFHSPKDQAVLKLLPDFTPRPKLSLPQVEAYLRVTQALGPISKQTLINYIEEGRIIATKEGGKWLVDRASFQQFLTALDQRLEAA